MAAALGIQGNVGNAAFKVSNILTGSRNGG